MRAPAASARRLGPARPNLASRLSGLGPVHPNLAPRLSGFLHGHTGAFLRELRAFAASGLDIGAFDRRARYALPGGTEPPPLHPESPLPLGTAAAIGVAPLGQPPLASPRPLFFESCPDPSHPPPTFLPTATATATTTATATATATSPHPTPRPRHDVIDLTDDNTDTETDEPTTAPDAEDIRRRTAEAAWERAHPDLMVVLPAPLPPETVVLSDEDDEDDDVVAVGYKPAPAAVAAAEVDGDMPEVDDGGRPTSPAVSAQAPEAQAPEDEGGHEDGVEVGAADGEASPAAKVGILQPRKVILVESDDDAPGAEEVPDEDEEDFVGYENEM
ncbi:hypothetical protein PAPYR_6035 [Paratrimastix pyriformis]|uniref:Uncharacterized protein n=1 Tax=Paratrimastix pyriformis TaxID=342808 RepID=A0ABQ8UJV2_9EUKA|nr:hypothetical protein PAPYR_6035 [Paratrimastix pyriformis]